MEQQQSTVCYIHVMHIAYIALFICTLVHLPCILGFVLECDHNILFWQVLGTCRWRIFRRPGIFWRTTTVQGSHLTLWDTQLFSSLQVCILILVCNLHVWYVCLSLCVVFSFDDLRAGLAFMKRRASHRSEGPITFVKSNLSSTLDCLESLDGMLN